MASVNKVMLIGNLGADPEIRYTKTGDAICTLSVATTDTWKDKASGAKQEATEWHRVVLFRRLAEVAGEYLKKGSSVFIDGSLRTRKWQDKDGSDRYTTEIEASEMKMLGGRSADEARPANGHRQGSTPSPASSSIAVAAPFSEDDDIPF